MMPVGHQNLGNDKKVTAEAESRTNSDRSPSNIRLMVTFLLAILAYVLALVSSRHRLALEAVALRQQLAVYNRKQPRLKLRPSDRLFWVILRQVGKNWSDVVPRAKNQF
jgi:hypothetical protein